MQRGRMAFLFLRKLLSFRSRMVQHWYSPNLLLFDRLLIAFTVLLVKVILYGIHITHHRPEIRIVQFVAPHKEIIMKEFGIACRIGKEQGIKLISEEGGMVCAEVAIEAPHEAVHLCRIAANV